MANRRFPLKSHSKEWLFYWLLLFVLAGCGNAETPVKLGGATMGTTWNVIYIEPAPSPAPEAVHAGIAELLAGINASMSTYQVDSEISKVNTLPAGTPVVPSKPFMRVLETALKVGRLTDGAYDITVGPLVDLWGFGAAGNRASPPGASEIADALARVGQDKVIVNSATGVVTKRGEIALDFSSLAKGYAVDQLARYLREQGITRYLIEVGGEMALAGTSPRGDLWQVAIEQPDPQTRSVAAALRLTDLAVATSGDYRNYFEVDGKRFSHAIDPATGYPVDHELVSVTVVHRSAMEADAWATALIVLGLDAALALAQAQGLAVYCIAERQGEFVHRYTAEMSGYIIPVP